MLERHAVSNIMDRHASKYLSCMMAIHGGHDMMDGHDGNGMMEDRGGKT